MKARYIQRGDSIDYTPTANVAAGDVIILGDLVGVAVRDIAANTLGALQTSGIFDFLKVAGEMTVGTLLYWNTSAKKATTTSSTYKCIGKVVIEAADDDEMVRLKLSSDAEISPITAGDAVVDLTDSTGGAAATELVAPAAADYTAAELKANFASLAAKYNELLASARDAGVVKT